MTRARLAAVFAATSFCAASASATPPITLHVNTGLWEVTSEVTFHGAPSIPPATLDRLPPEQRARLMAAMHASMANAAKPHSTKSCVTQKDLDRPFRGAPDEPGMTCRESVVSATSTVEEIKLACTGKRTMDGSFRFEAPTPTTMQGHVTMSFSEGGRTMNSTAELHGQWLGPNCGSVRPSQGG